MNARHRRAWMNALLASSVVPAGWIRVTAHPGCTALCRAAPGGWGGPQRPLVPRLRAAEDGGRRPKRRRGRVQSLTQSGPLQRTTGLRNRRLGAGHVHQVGEGGLQPSTCLHVPARPRDAGDRHAGCWWAEVACRSNSARWPRPCPERPVLARQRRLSHAAFLGEPGVCWGEPGVFVPTTLRLARALSQNDTRGHHPS